MIYVMYSTQNSIYQKTCCSTTATFNKIVFFEGKFDIRCQHDHAQTIEIYVNLSWIVLIILLENS